MSVYEAKWDRFRGRRVLVLGMGRSGIAACGLLATVAEVHAWDAKPLPNLSDDARNLVERGEVDFVAEVSEALLNKVDLVVRSPGVPWDAPVVAAARDLGLEPVSYTHLTLPTIYSV